MSDGYAADQYRVLHVTEAAAGGVLQHLDCVLPGLQRRKIPCACFIFSARADSRRLPDMLNRWHREGIAVRWLPLPEHWLRKPGCWLAVLREFRALVREFRPDILHFHSSQAGGVGRLLLPFLPGRFKVVYSPHAFYWHLEMPASLRWRVKAAEQLLTLFTDRFILVGSGEKLQGKQMGLPWRNKAVLIPNGLPPDWGSRMLPREEARRSLKILPDELAVVVPGRFAWQKGQVRLLEMLAGCRLPDHCRIYFCGEKVRQIPRLHPALAAGDRFVFLDHVEKLSVSLSAFDMGILPSRYEGFSYALLEMMAAGMPVLASDIPENKMLTDRAGGAECRLSVWQNENQFRELLQQKLSGHRIPVRDDRIIRLFPLEEQLDGLGAAYAALVRSK